MAVQYKMVIVGDGAVGKTTFINKIRTNVFKNNYNPTLGVEVHPIDLGPVTINCWDCAGQDKFAGLRDGYYINATIAIIMFDLTSENSFNKIKEYYIELTRINPRMYIMLCGNKSDLHDPNNPNHVLNNDIDNLRNELNIGYTSVSVLTNNNLKETFKQILNPNANQ